MSQIGSSFVYRAKRIMITREVFDRELQRIRPTLVQIAQRHLNDADEAEDTVQEVMLRLWQMVDELRLPIDRLAAILTKNLCIDKLRRRKTMLRVEDISDISHEDSDTSLLEQTMKMIDQLPEMQQTIIRLRHMEGMEMKEIASLTGSTEVAIRKALSRARKALAQKVLSATK